MLAAKEKTEPLGASLAHAKTRVWGLPPGNEDGIGGSSTVTSTHVWGWGHVYVGTASGALDNRYYSNAYGRFMTPDPYQATAISPSDPSNPQSWNRYAYVNGDPVNGNDPQGLYEQLLWASGGEDGFFFVSFNGCSPGWDGIWGASYGCGSGPTSINIQGIRPPTSATNAQPLNSPIFGQLAAALANTDCGKWFDAGYSTSADFVKGQSLTAFLTNVLPTVTGSANFVGGNANAAEGGLVPGYAILFNNAGAFFKPVPGQTLGFSNSYASQFASINGGSPEAQAFLMLHELGHLFGMLLPDATSTKNQAINNDDIWRNCDSVIQGFSNQSQ